MKKARMFVLGSMVSFAIIGTSFNAYSGCNNEPDNNNGDCTYATGAGGSVIYFCEDSLIFHDCVKVDESTIQE